MSIELSTRLDGPSTISSYSVSNRSDLGHKLTYDSPVSYPIVLLSGTEPVGTDLDMLWIVCWVGLAFHSLKQGTERIVVCQSIAQPAIRMEFEGRGVTQLFAVSLSSAVGLLFGGE